MDKNNTAPTWWIKLSKLKEDWPQEIWKKLKKHNSDDIIDLANGQEKQDLEILRIKNELTKINDAVKINN